jgi:predicted nucleic acid-binding protein
LIHVVDNSVVVKWFIDERGSDRAVPLMRRSLTAPDLLVPEFVNTMRSKVLRGMLRPDEARVAVKALQSCGITFESTEPLAPAMLDLALRLSHSAYDCAYLALALRQDGVLITADERLLARCRKPDAADLAPHVLSLYEAGLEVQERPAAPYRPRLRKSHEARART